MDETAEELHNARVHKYVTFNAAAALAFLIWDVLISLDEEVRYIWNPRSRCQLWKRLLYLLLRYIPIITETMWFSQFQALDSFPMMCRFLFILKSVTIFLSMSAVQFILVLQVCALYHNNRMIHWLLVGLWTSELIIIAVNIPMRLAKVRLDAATCQAMYQQAPGLRAMLMLILALPVALGAILLVMTGFVFVFGFGRGLGRRPPLLTLLVRDGAWAFMLITVGTMLTLISLLMEAAMVSILMTTWLMSNISFTGAHLILNMETLTAPPSFRNTFTAQYELQVTSVPENVGILTTHVAINDMRYPV